MGDSVAGVVLGAGAGERFRPLSTVRPKVLCPVDGTPLVDLAIERLRTVTGEIAANAHASQVGLIAHLEGSVHLSVEVGETLGTAGALGALRPWLDGRDVVVVNGDTWCPGSMASLVADWDRHTIRILVPGGGPFGPGSPVAGAALPAADIAALEATPSGLWEVSWRAALEAGRIEVVPHSGSFVDCATPADYLAANLVAAGGSAIGAGARVDGEVVESVVWPDAVVFAHERLYRCIRTDTGRTVMVRGELPSTEWTVPAEVARS